MARGRKVGGKGKGRMTGQLDTSAHRFAIEANRGGGRGRRGRKAKR